MGAFDRARSSPPCTREIDVLVVPSLWLENSPLVIHEAFMAGIPVVAARIGGIVDLVRDGENGLLYEATSSVALTNALRSLIEQPERVGQLSAARPNGAPNENDRGGRTRMDDDVFGAGRPPFAARARRDRAARVHRAADAERRSDAACAVRRDRDAACLDFEFELVVVDSQSTDGTAEFVRPRAASLVSIDRESFDHGLARNLGIEHSKGESDRADGSGRAPASDTWLAD